MTQTPRPAEPRILHRTNASATAARAARSGPSTGRLVALVVVLAGLFGMHGLAGHGSHDADTSISVGMGKGDSMVTMTTLTTAATTDVAVEAQHRAMASAVASRAVTSAGRSLVT